MRTSNNLENKTPSINNQLIIYNLILKTKGNKCTTAITLIVKLKILMEKRTHTEEFS